MNDPIIWLNEDQDADHGWEAAGRKNPAIEWLEAEFTYQWATLAFRNSDLVPGPECRRPMVQIIDQLESCETDCYGPMYVDRSDYDDPLRWWL